AERIPHKVGCVLDFRHLIIVGENDRVQPFLERQNLVRKAVHIRGWYRFPNREAVHGKGLSFGDMQHTVKLPSGKWSVNRRLDRAWMKRVFGWRDRPARNDSAARRGV